MFPDLSEIKKRRVRLDLTQKRLAQIAGVSQSLIAKIESGKIDPSYSSARKIFGALEGFVHEENKTARDIMSQHVLSASPQEPLRSVLETMRKRNIEQMPVMEKDAVVGSVSEDSIVHFLSTYKGSRNILDLKVGDVMAESFPIVKEDANYRLLLELLNYNRAVLIARKGKVVGIVTKTDLLKTR